MSNLSMAGFIRAHRLRIGLTQKELAERAHISVSYVVKFERGRVPSEKILDQLATVFGLDSESSRALYVLAGKGHQMAAHADSTFTGQLYTSMLGAGRKNAISMVVDAHLNLLDASDTCRASFPGLDEHPSFAEWFFFDPRARLVHEQWEQEAASILWWFRRAVAKDAGHDGLTAQISRLKESADFRRLWADPTASRQPGDTMMIRDYRTREVVTLMCGFFHGFPKGDAYVWIGVPIAN